MQRERPPFLRRILYLGTPLLSEPGDRGAKIAYLQEDTLVEVLSSGDGFLHVRTEQGGVGYVRQYSISEDFSPGLLGRSGEQEE